MGYTFEDIENISPYYEKMFIYAELHLSKTSIHLVN